MSDFKCERCGNTDEKYIGYINGKPYCRKCIILNGENAPDYKTKRFQNPLKLEYKLTKEQEDVSNQILNNFINNIDTLVVAVCGAGKTELCYQTINYALQHGLFVGFAVPRRDVAIELAPRIQKAFPETNVTLVHGGNTSKLVGDIVVLTTHQLYRYNKRFDLLILDEIDAFPFKNSEILPQMFTRSVKGHHILMSATADENIQKKYHSSGKMMLELNVRFHHHEIPVPRIIRGILFIKYVVLLVKLKQFLKKQKPVLIFAPTIELCEQIYSFLKVFFKHGDVVNSKCEKRAQIIKTFKEGGYKYLVTTSILERGVTIEGLQVIIMYADHTLYDKSALIQISGRVGRKANDPKGEVIFLADKRSDAMENARKEIIAKNENLQNLLQ